MNLSNLNREDYARIVYHHDKVENEYQSYYIPKKIIPHSGIQYDNNGNPSSFTIEVLTNKLTFKWTGNLENNLEITAYGQDDKIITIVYPGLSEDAQVFYPQFDQDILTQIYFYYHENDINECEGEIFFISKLSEYPSFGSMRSAHYPGCILLKHKELEVVISDLSVLEKVPDEMKLLENIPKQDFNKDEYFKLIDAIDRT